MRTKLLSRRTISDELEEESKSERVGETAKANPPPVEKRFGLRRTTDKVLLATGCPESLFSLRAILEDEADELGFSTGPLVVVRLARSSQARRAAARGSR